MKKRDKTPGFSKLKFLHNPNFALLIMFLMLLSISLINVNLTGLTVYLQKEVIDDYPSLDLTSDYIYSSFINEKNFDHLATIKLSGRVSKSGNVKVKIGDVLIFDTSQLLEEDKITGLGITNETFDDSNNSLENNTETEGNETLDEGKNTDDYIVFDDYCLDSCNMFFNDTSINLSFEVLNSNIKIDKISYSIINKEEELEPTSIVNESTVSDEIFVEKDIKWTKTIELKEYGVVNTTLPSESKNIEISKVVNDNEFDVDKDKIKIENPNLIGKDKPVTIIIEDQALKFEINYETPGPSKDESISIRDKYKILKNVTISSDLELENVTSYVDLPNILKEQIKLRWFDENSSTWVDITGNETYDLTYYDSNYDGKFERVYWNIPHLSDQDFSLEIDLLILNVQSYPQVGGNWLVYFNTTGTADLAIEAIDGTTWSNLNDNEDLRFLELKCGNNLVDYQWVDSKVFVSNYNCDGLTSVEASRVISSGSHHLSFTFGNLIAFANNEAGGYGYNSTDNSFTDKDGLNFKADNNGIITVRRNGLVVGRFGFGMTATFQGNNYNFTSEDFNWTWSLRQNVNDYTFIAYNNWSSFNWTQYFDFSPSTSVKIKHTITNNFGAPITNGKFWYIHTLNNLTRINYNSTYYTVGLDNIHLQGNFNYIVPHVSISDHYLFKFDDLINNNFTISDVYIGDGSLIQHPNTLIMAVGVTKGIGTLPSGASVTLDPGIIIVITKAEHLNENREFVSDIYDSVVKLDGYW